MEFLRGMTTVDLYISMMGILLMVNNMVKVLYIYSQERLSKDNGMKALTFNGSMNKKVAMLIQYQKFVKRRWIEIWVLVYSDSSLAITKLNSSCKSYF